MSLSRRFGVSGRCGRLQARRVVAGGVFVARRTPCPRPATPSRHGTTLYLDGGADLPRLLARVEKAGSAVAVPKTGIGNDFGFVAHFIDTEGNRFGLHGAGGVIGLGASPPGAWRSGRP